MRRSEVDQDTTHGRVRYLHGVGTGRDGDGRAGLLGRAEARGCPQFKDDVVGPILPCSSQLS